MGYHCDSCIASAVVKKKVRPLNAVYGPNNSTFKRNTICHTCGKKGSKHEGFWLHYEMDNLKEVDNS